MWSRAADNLSGMRFLWTYLIVGIVFAFGFVCASTFTVGKSPPRRAPRGVEPDMSRLPLFRPRGARASTGRRP